MRRATVSVIGRILLVALCVLPLGFRGAYATPREITGAGFRYYVLSLYWLPTLCRESPGADECSGTTPTGFIVHGLWPVLDSNSPTNCGGADEISDALVRSLKDLFPTRRLVEREWQIHGTCSGQSPQRFFALLRQAYESVFVPQLLSSAASTTQTFHQVRGAFVHLDHNLISQAVVVTCSDPPALLREVRICLSKDLATTYCSGETLAAACRSLNLQIPAVP